jgi:hypothetical protein
MFYDPASGSNPTYDLGIYNCNASVVEGIAQFFCGLVSKHTYVRFFSVIAQGMRTTYRKVTFQTMRCLPMYAYPGYKVWFKVISYSDLYIHLKL